MKSKYKNINELKSRVSSRAFRTYKIIYQNYLAKRSKKKRILFILGCQRSGTSMMMKIFDNDIHTKVYGEFSELSATHSDPIRLAPYPHVFKTINNTRAVSIVMKPLVESQNAVHLLDYFVSSNALWMFRHYKDVVSSGFIHWGSQNGIKNLFPIIRNDQTNWRSQGVSRKTRNLIARYYSRDMSPYDAEVLFWYMRNVLFFEQDLHNDPRVLMCKYEDLVTAPWQTVKAIYTFAGFKLSDKNIVSMVHSNSVQKGKQIELSPAIDELCSDLWGKLNNSYLAQMDCIKQQEFLPKSKLSGWRLDVKDRYIQQTGTETAPG
jgi:hypothetical protein